MKFSLAVNSFRTRLYTVRLLYNTPVYYGIPDYNALNYSYDSLGPDPRDSVLSNVLLVHDALVGEIFFGFLLYFLGKNYGLFPARGVRSNYERSVSGDSREITVVSFRHLPGLSTNYP